MQPSQEANSFHPESTHLFFSVTALESVDEHCPTHQDLCRKGKGRSGEEVQRIGEA